MKRLLLPLLAALALPTAVNAETWILVGSKIFPRDIDGSTNAHKYYIDASTVIKNGNWRYANGKYEGPLLDDINGIKADCKEKIIFYSKIISFFDNDEELLEWTFKRINRDNWAATENGVENEMEQTPLVEGVYQFLCKEWE